MSLVKTLGRIAVGIAVAKGVGKMMNRGGSPAAGGGGLGGLLGGVLGGAGGSAGGLGGALGGALGGRGGSSGGLGDMGALLGGKAGGAGMAGGLGGLLESISGAAGRSGGTGGGLGGALGGVLGGALGGGNVPSPGSGSLGDLLNSALQGKPVPEPEPAQEDQARILIQAMVNAAKSDGTIDQEEQQKIVSHLGDEVTEEERDFVIREMQSPLDLEGFIRTVPRGSEMQVYMMSLLGIDLDSREEAQYLDRLRKGMGLSEEQANAIHEQLGVPTLYR